MTKPLRVAIVAACPFPYPRGTPVRIFRMAEALSELGHEIHVITYHLGEKVESINFTLHRIPNLSFYKKVNPGPSYLKLMVVDPLLAYKIIKLHHQYNFDLFHAHHIEGLMAAWPVRLYGKTPIIYDAHTLLGTELHHYDLYLEKRTKKQIGRLLDKYLPRLADYVICVSDQIHSQLIHDAHISPDDISIISNGIEFNHFARKVPEKDTDGKEEVILGFSGNFSEYQGIDIMLEAVSLLKESFPKIKLHLYSNDSFKKYRPLIEKLMLDIQISVLPTSFQVLPDQLSNADILLNPRFDGAGIPLKLINYMAAGKPIVSFSGSAHIMQHGKTGWVVDGNNPHQFADGIKYLLENRHVADNLGQNARNHVRQNYSWSSRGKEVIRIYEKLLDRN
jgi:glycosyltransferase involved in cell wall biosynthesis